MKLFSSNTDKEWERFGKNDPYFGVISDNKYKVSNLTVDHKEEFFQSGYAYMDRVITRIKKYLDPGFTIKNALDFGCGVGRLVIPISEVAEKVTGVDVSESMLSKARNNCEVRSLKNIDFVKSDDQLSLLNEKFNFIHSFIVFQHIPVKRGEHIFRKLLFLLEDGGCGVVHFTYAKLSKIKNLIALIKKYVPLAKNILNLMKGKPFFAPVMQMNNYDLNRLFFILQQANVCEFFTELTDHGGDLGIIVYFKKQEKDIVMSKPGL